MKLCRILALGACLLDGAPAFATTYYVDWTNGNDSNTGMSKSAPWKRAPGMNGVAGAAAAKVLIAGDSVILKGCVTWPNTAFTWTVSQSGSAGTSIYYGVDQTWWDNSVAGCTLAWNRPIFDLGNQNPSDSLNRIIDITGHDITIDNFEMKNMAANWNPINGTTTAIAWDGSGNTVVERMYIHGWHNPCISVGTGSLTSGSTTITNFAPYPYSPSPTTAWGSGSGVCGHGIQLQAVTGGIPLGNSCPTVTSVTGSGPYTITFTCGAGGATSTKTGAVIQLGADLFNVVGGVNGPNANHGDMMLNNVIDGSDTAEVQWNPYPDCGLSEGNNNMCIATGTVAWRQPNIWRNNVIRYVFNVAIATCTEWSGNLIEYQRGQGGDPTGHSNAIECAGNDNPYSNGATLFYNNVFRHLNNPNPNTPTGIRGIGLGNIQTQLVTGETAYIFNNVMHDTLANAVFEHQVLSGSPKQVIFNNSVDCGVAALGLTQNCIDGEASGDVISNNYMVTSAPLPIGTCGGYTCQANVIQTPSQATAIGSVATSPFAYSTGPITSGTNLSSICATIGAVQPAAGAACLSDTTYGAFYDITTHQALTGARTSVPRGSSWTSGAYQGSSSGGTLQPPTVLAAMPH